MDDILVTNLTKKYKDVLAIDRLNCSFKANSINGLLGRNGSGKTTLLNILSNRLVSSDGKITIGDKEIRENDMLLKDIYYVTENCVYITDKIKNFINETKIFYKDFDIDYCNRLCEAFEVNTKLKLTEMSTGYKTIIKNIVALSTNAKTLIFDEPVLGMDANSREKFYKLAIEKYAQTNCTMIISTHLIEEISEFIEHVVIIDRGKFKFQGNVDYLLDNAYHICGNKDEIYKIEKYLNVINKENETSLYVVDENIKIINEFNLSVSKLSLQDLFSKWIDI